MKILVTGANGQLGIDLVQFLDKHKFNYVATDINDLDLTKHDEVHSFFQKHKNFSHLIHCAAYTAVDMAEEKIKTAYKVNYEATKVLSHICKSNNIVLMYISTDYVYPGKGDVPYKETDKTGPLGVYGKSKLKGEEIVQKYLDNFFIIRISWVFGLYGENFVKKMLSLSENNEFLKIVDDQIGSPTYTYDLVPLLIKILKSNKFGIYNVSNSGYCSWKEFAEKIFAIYGKEIKIIPIKSEELVTKAMRPKNSRMCKQKLLENDFHLLRHWEEALTHFIQNYKQSKE